MRFSRLTISASLATAACSSGPDDQQRASAQSEMQSCMGIGKADGVMARHAPTLTEVKTRLDGLNAEKIVKQEKPDFSISGSVAPYTLESKDGDKTIKSKMNVSITFKSVGGVESANVFGSKITIEDDDKIGRNDPFYSENIGVETEDFQGINVAGILKEGRACAIGAQAKLGL